MFSPKFGYLPLSTHGASAKVVGRTQTARMIEHLHRPSAGSEEMIMDDRGARGRNDDADEDDEAHARSHIRVKEEGEVLEEDFIEMAGV